MGLITAKFYFSEAQAIANPDFNIEVFIERQKNMLFHLMPPGTSFLGMESVVETNVFGLNNSFRVEFEHPAFENGSTLDVMYRRLVKVVDKDTPYERIQITDLIDGIRYLKPDGTSYFNY